MLSQFMPGVCRPVQETQRNVPIRWPADSCVVQPFRGRIVTLLTGSHVGRSKRVKSACSHTHGKSHPMSVRFFTSRTTTVSLCSRSIPSLSRNDPILAACRCVLRAAGALQEWVNHPNFSLSNGNILSNAGVTAATSTHGYVFPTDPNFLSAPSWFSGGIRSLTLGAKFVF